MAHTVRVTDHTGPDGLVVEHQLVLNARGQLLSRTRGAAGLSWKYNAEFPGGVLRCPRARRGGRGRDEAPRCVRFGARPPNQHGARGSYRFDTAGHFRDPDKSTWLDVRVGSSSPIRPRRGGLYGRKPSPRRLRKEPISSRQHYNSHRPKFRKVTRDESAQGRNQALNAATVQFPNRLPLWPHNRRATRPSPCTENFTPMAESLRYGINCSQRAEEADTSLLILAPRLSETLSDGAFFIFPSSIRPAPRPVLILSVPGPSSVRNNSTLHSIRKARISELLHSRN